MPIGNLADVLFVPLFYTDANSIQFSSIQLMEVEMTTQENIAVVNQYEEEVWIKGN